MALCSYSNPLNSSTTVSYCLPSKLNAEIKIYLDIK